MQVVILPEPPPAVTFAALIQMLVLDVLLCHVCANSLLLFMLLLLPFNRPWALSERLARDQAQLLLEGLQAPDFFAFQG